MLSSKESLEMYHRIACHHSVIVDDSNHYETIKKDLEVLDILKNESDNKRIIERDGIVSFHLDMILTADNYNKIKEWLENDNFLLKVAQIYSKKNNEKK